MKKLLSMSLVVVMVLALGGLAMASGLNGNLEAQIPVKATVEAYAAISEIVGVDFGEITGATGKYAATPGGFKVESNTDVRLDFSVENPSWINSPYVFTVQQPGPLSGFHASFGTGGDAAATNFIEYTYRKSATVLEVTGTMLLQSISQNKADTYETNILVTVSKL